MESTEPRELSARELAHALRSVDPRVVLVPARVLRRIVRGTLQIRGFFRFVPHWDGLTIATESALNFAGRDCTQQTCNSVIDMVTRKLIITGRHGWNKVN